MKIFACGRPDPFHFKACLSFFVGRCWVTKICQGIQVGLLLLQCLKRLGFFFCTLIRLCNRWNMHSQKTGLAVEQWIYWVTVLASHVFCTVMSWEKECELIFRCEPSFPCTCKSHCCFHKIRTFSLCPSSGSRTSACISMHHLPENLGHKEWKRIFNMFNVDEML